MGASLLESLTLAITYFTVDSRYCRSSYLTRTSFLKQFRLRRPIGGKAQRCTKNLFQGIYFELCIRLPDTCHVPCCCIACGTISQFFLGKNSPRNYIYMQVTCYRPSSTRHPLQNSVLKNHGLSIEEGIYITVFREASQANTFINCNQLKHVMPQNNGF